MVVYAGYTYPTFRAKNGVIKNQLPEVPKAESQVLYSLFKKINGQWKRARNTAFPERVAIKLWGDDAMSNPQNFSIRKVRIQTNPAEGITKGHRATYNEFRDSPLRERIAR